jgi:Na+-transporting NADH:ubiquinone oxidoreductase subunit NqrA
MKYRLSGGSHCSGMVDIHPHIAARVDARKDYVWRFY